MRRSRASCCLASGSSSLPWTLLAYLVIYPGGVTGFDWVILGLGVLADIATYTGGGYGNRRRLPGYQQTPPV